MSGTKHNTPNGVSGSKNSTMSNVCAVCYLPKNTSMLITCRKCGVTVHRNCYHAKPADAQNWLCSKCEQGAGEVHCVLCPNKDGAFKRVTDTEWVHLDCLRFLPDSRIDRVPSDHWRIPCKLCNSSHGACVECIADDCKCSFHPSCARKAKLVTTMLPAKSPGGARIGAFCHLHSAQHRKPNGRDSPAVAPLAPASASAASSSNGADSLAASRPSSTASANTPASARSGNSRGFRTKSALLAARKPSTASASANDVCCVCFNGDVDEGNDIVFCARCGIAVHQACYGIAKLPAGDWSCRRCEKGLAVINCVLCPVREGAFKPTTDGRWAHVLCGLWIPETSLVDSVALEPIDGINRIHPQRWKLVCHVCSKRYGVCIQCSVPGCSVAWHPLCGQQAGLRMEVKEFRSTLADDAAEPEDIRFLGYCRKHADTVFDPSTLKKKEKPKPKLEPPPRVPSHVIQQQLQVQQRKMVKLKDFQNGKLKKKKGKPGRPPKRAHRDTTQTGDEGESTRDFDENDLTDDDRAASSDDDDEVTDRESFLRLIDGFFRPLAEGDMQRLGSAYHHASLKQAGPTLSASHASSPSQALVPLARRPDVDLDPSFLLPLLGHKPALSLDFQLARFPSFRLHDDLWRLIGRSPSRRQRVKNTLPPTSQPPSVAEGQPVTLNALLLTGPADQPRTAMFCELQSRPAVKKEGQVKAERSGDGPPLDLTLVGVHSAFDPDFTPSVHGLRLRSLRSSTGLLTQSTSPPLADASAPDPDSVLSELVSSQRRLQAQIEQNAVLRERLRVAVDQRKPMTEVVSQRIQTHQLDVINKFRFSSAWQMVRLALCKGVRDQPWPPKPTARQHYAMQLRAQAAAAASVPALRLLEQRPRTRGQAAGQTTGGLSLSHHDQSASAAAASSSDSEKTDSKEREQRVLEESKQLKDPESELLLLEMEEQAASDFSVCCVCFDGESSDENPIVFCERCNISVHKFCYGIANIPEDDWFCQYCLAHPPIRLPSDAAMQLDEVDIAVELSVSALTSKRGGRGGRGRGRGRGRGAASGLGGPGRPEEGDEDDSKGPKSRYQCSLCPVPGGALKRCEDGGWAHIVCALWVPGARLADVTAMQRVQHADAVVKQQRSENVLCHLCKKEHGACMRCSVPGCTLFFHPLCAWYGGLVMYVESAGIDLRFFIFCAEHTPKSALEGLADLSSDEQNALDAVPAKPNERPTSRAAVPAGSVAEDAPTGSVVSLGIAIPSVHVKTVKMPSLGAANALPNPPRSRYAALPFTDVTIATAAANSVLTALSARRMEQQKDVRNRGRQEQTRKNKRLRRRKRQLERKLRAGRARALREDRYETGRCCVCFKTEAEYELETKLEAEAAKTASSDPQAPAPSAPTDDVPALEAVNALSAKAGMPAVHSECNRMVRCDKCDIEVHQRCYGISDAELDQIAVAKQRAREQLFDDDDDAADDGDGRSGWLCGRCKSTDKDIQCALCPRKGGAFKLTTNGRWAHVACAQWLPEVTFVDPVKMEPIDGVNEVAKSRRKLKCYLCKRPGPCIQCSDQCSTPFHPLCGLFSGAYMSIHEDKTGSSTTFTACCRKHTPIHLARGIDVPPAFTRMLMLRRQLDKARTLIDLVKRREKLKQRVNAAKVDQLEEQWATTRGVLPPTGFRPRVRVLPPEPTPSADQAPTVDSFPRPRARAVDSLGASAGGPGSARRRQKLALSQSPAPTPAALSNQLAPAGRMSPTARRGVRVKTPSAVMRDSLQQGSDILNPLAFSSPSLAARRPPTASPTGQPAATPALSPAQSAKSKRPKKPQASPLAPAASPAAPPAATPPPADASHASPAPRSRKRGASQSGSENDQKKQKRDAAESPAAKPRTPKQTASSQADPQAAAESPAPNKRKATDSSASEPRSKRARLASPASTSSASESSSAQPKSKKGRPRKADAPTATPATPTATESAEAKKKAGQAETSAKDESKTKQAASGPKKRKKKSRLSSKPKKSKPKQAAAEPASAGTAFVVGQVIKAWQDDGWFRAKIVEIETAKNLRTRSNASQTPPGKKKSKKKGKPKDGSVKSRQSSTPRGKHSTQERDALAANAAPSPDARLFLVHFHGWNKRHDCWVPEEHVSVRDDVATQDKRAAIFRARRAAEKPAEKKEETKAPAANTAEEDSGSDESDDSEDGSEDEGEESEGESEDQSEAESGDETGDEAEDQSEAESGDEGSDAEEGGEEGEGEGAGEGEAEGDEQSESQESSDDDE